MLTQMHPTSTTSTTPHVPSTDHYRSIALRLFGEAARSTEKEDEMIVAAEHDGRRFRIIGKNPSEDKLAVFTETSMFTFKGGKIQIEEFDESEYPSCARSPYNAVYQSKAHHIATVEAFQKALTKEYRIVYKDSPSLTEEAMKFAITRVGNRAVKLSNHRILKRANIRKTIHRLIALSYSDHFLQAARQQEEEDIKAESKKSKLRKG